MKTHEFYNELKQLTQLGYLEQAQLDRIQNEYIMTRKENRSVLLIFALLGVSFIGAGVISLFAYNWTMFTREMKAFIAFLPLLGIQGVLYWKIRSNGSEVWIKSLTLALGIAFLSALGLIYQAYQISYSLTSMMLTGFVCMLPVIYLLDGYYLGILYLGGLCWAGGNSDGILLALLLLPYYRKRLRGGKSCRMLSLFFFTWLLYLAIRYVPNNAYYACILILLIYMTIEKPDLYVRLAGRLLYVMLFFKGVFYLFYNDFAAFMMHGNRNWYWNRLPQLWLFLLLAWTLRRICIYCKKGTKNQRVGLLLTGLVCGLLVTDIVIPPLACMFAYQVLVNLGLIGFSLYKLTVGITLANPASVRRYTAAIILYIVMKVSFGNYPLLVKGIIFVIAGLAFLAVNYRISSKQKGVNEYENTPE